MPFSSPIIIGTKTTVPAQYLRNPEGALIDFTLENGAWRAGSDLPRFFPEAEAVRDELDAIVAVRFPRAADLTPWLRPEVAGQVPIMAESLDRSHWPRVWLGDGDVQLGPHDLMPYDQGPAWEAISKEPDRWPWGRILVLKCGSGKTALALKLAKYRGVRTIVICHTLNMARQWSGEAEHFLGYPKSEHGFIGGGKVDWRSRDLVFTSMPGLLCREYPEEFWYRWGLVVVDEGDLLGATQLRKLLGKFFGERLIATATLERRDGNEKLFFLHVGEVCYYDIDDDVIPDVFVLESPVPAMVQVEVRPKKKKGQKRGKPRVEFTPAERTVYIKRLKRTIPHIPKTISFLSEHKPRMEWCVRVVRKLLDEGRKVLFLSGRVDDIYWLHRQATKLWGDVRSGMVLGQQHQKIDISDAVVAECDIIWGITNLGRRGLNDRRIDTVVIQYSAVNEPGAVRQMKGRACRVHPEKKKPLIVVLNDKNVACLHRNTEKVVAQLTDQGSEVTWYDG